MDGWIRHGQDQMVLARSYLIGWRWRPTHVQKIGLVLELVGDNLVRFVIRDFEEVGGLVRDEFLRKVVRVLVKIFNRDTILWVRFECRPRPNEEEDGKRKGHAREWESHG